MQMQRMMVIITYDKEISESRFLYQRFLYHNSGVVLEDAEMKISACDCARYFVVVGGEALSILL